MDEIDIKFQEIIGYQKLIAEEPNIEFDFMDRVSKDDLLDKIDTLQKANELSDAEIKRLKREEDELIKGIELSKKKVKDVGSKAQELEDKDINHSLDQV